MRFKRVFLVFVLFGAGNLFAWTHLGTGLNAWRPGKIPVYVNTAQCSGSISDAELYAVVDKALQLWNSAPNTNIQLVREPQEATKTEAEFISEGSVVPLPDSIAQVPLILCSTNFSLYGNLGPADEDQILAFVPYFRAASDGYVRFSGLVLNATGGASDLKNKSQTEREIIIAHELGHVLGLGHSSDPDALMYFQLNKNFLLLTLDDQDGMAHLYPSNELGTLMGCSAIHQATTRVPVRGFIGVILFLLMVIVSARWFFSIEPLPESEE